MTPHQLRVPVLIAGVDIRSLPLSALEGFVLSRIDGRADVLEIVTLTGLGQEQVLPILDKLEQLGAIRYGEGSKPSISPSGASARPAPGQPSGAPSSQRPRSTSGRPIRRNSLPPRRMMAESGYSQPSPDMRHSRSPSHPAGPAARVSSAPPATGYRGTPQVERVESSKQRKASGQAADRTHSRVDADRTQPRVDVDRTQPRVDVDRSRPGVDADRTQPRVSVAGARSDSGVQQRPSAAQHAPQNMAIPPGPPSKPDVLSDLVGQVSYDPRELLEDVDLAMDRRKHVLDLYYSMSELDFYELLGVAYDADKKGIRAAYFALSKVFHPDTMFRKNLGAFKPKMEAVFNVLTEAYNTLGKKKTREEYDNYLRITKKTQMAERTLRMQERAAMEAALREEQAAAAVVSMAPEPPERSLQPPPPPSAPARPVSAESRKLAQQVIERRLRGVVGSMREAPRQVTAAPEPARPVASGRTDPQELVRRLAKTLKDVGNVTGSNDQLTRHVRASQAAFARGDLAEATQQMRRAISIAPDRQDLAHEHERLSKMLSEKLAADYEQQAAFEAKSGKWASAALSWSKVCEGRPKDPNAHKHAAQCMLKAGADLRGAQKYAQQAVFLAPDDVDLRILLAQIYMTIGLKLNAKRELDTAAKLDPDSEMVKNLRGDLNS